MQNKQAQAKANEAVELPASKRKAMTHDSVMLEEVLEIFAPLGNGLILDATFGRGGHSRAILNQTSCSVFAIDCDKEAVEYALKQPFFRKHDKRFAITQGPFASANKLLAQHDINALDGVLFDYGISSTQLDDAERGFSFQKNGPLDMRIAQQGATAQEFLQSVTEQGLLENLRACGEQHARRITRAIIQARAEKKLPHNTQQLAELVRANIPRKITKRPSYNFRKNQTRAQRDSATLTFMAIRIAVNNELEQIAEGLRQADAMLNEGGRIAAISFHSLEDRIVKQQFAAWTGRRSSQSTTSRHRASLEDIAHSISSSKKNTLADASPSMQAQLLAKQPRYRYISERLLRPSLRERSANPRSRSAKLRAVEKHTRAYKDDKRIGSVK